MFRCIFFETFSLFDPHKDMFWLWFLIYACAVIKRVPNACVAINRLLDIFFDAFGVLALNCRRARRDVRVQVAKLQADVAQKDKDAEQHAKDLDLQRKLVQKRFNWGKQQKAEGVKAQNELRKARESIVAMQKELAQMRDEYTKSAGPADQCVAVVCGGVDAVVLPLCVGV